MPLPRATPAAALLLAGSLVAPAAAVDDIRYVVQRGDTLLGIAGRGLSRPADWRALAAANGITEPRHLYIGRSLRVPGRLLRREPLAATVTAFSGAVRLDPGDAPVALGTPIAAGTTLRTGANSFVTVELADASRVTLPSQSAVRVARLDRLPLDGRIDRQFDLLTGRSDYAVTPRRGPNDRFRITTPVAVAAVRGTEFRVTYEAGHSAIDVLEGSVATQPRGAGRDTAIAAGSAAVVAAGTLHTANLPPAPQLREPARVQDEPELVFRITGDAAPRHRVQLARDAGFVDLFAEAETGNYEARFTGVGNGTLFVRLTGIDAEGVEGRPATHQFTRFQTGLAAEAGALPDGRTRFRWQASGAGRHHYRFVLARDPALVDRIVDRPGLAASELTVAALPAGHWYWQVTATMVDTAGRVERALPVQELTLAR